MNNTDCQEILELIPAYAIGATDAEETALVETNLAYCPDAEAELALYNDVISDVLLMPEKLVTPPPALEQKIMAAAIPKPRRSVSIRGWRVAAVIAILWAIGFTIWGLQQASERMDTEDELAAAEARNEALQALLQGSDNEVVLTANVENEFSARLRWNNEEDIGLLETNNLPPVSEDETYQAWILAGDSAVSLGAFEIDENGDALVIVDLPFDIEPFQSIGVSVEPLGGSETPTTTPLLIGRLSED